SRMATNCSSLCLKIRQSNSIISYEISASASPCTVEGSARTTYSLFPTTKTSKSSAPLLEHSWKPFRSFPCCSSTTRPYAVIQTVLLILLPTAKDQIKPHSSAQP